jgi:endoglucanase
MRVSYRRTISRCGPPIAMLSLMLLLILPAISAAQMVHEITIATPTVLALEVRDPPFKRGSIASLPARSEENQGTWIKFGGDWGLVIGPERDHVRIADTPPATYLDRARVDAPGGYSDIGGNHVTAVFRKSVPYDSGIYRGANGETMTGASLKHFIYLQLSNPLSEGSMALRWPAGTLPETAVEYSSRRTRAIALRVNQHGYRASDMGKVAYLALWLPGAPAEGAVDFREFGISRFEIIDEKGEAQYSGEIRVRTAPTDPEPGNGLSAPLLEYPSIAHGGVKIRAIDRGPPITVSAPSHGFSLGQNVWLDGLAGPLKPSNGLATVRAPTRDSFELHNLRSSVGTQGSDGPPVAMPVHQSNRAGTFVFELDFGAWKPHTSGRYRVHVPGLGVSDTFDVRGDVWLEAGRMSIGGLYNHRSGIALDGRFGFRRPVAFKPGEGMTVRLSHLPLSWTNNSSLGLIPAENGAKAPWVKDDLAPPSYWGGYMDAGDWDRRIDHLDVSYLFLDVFESAPDVMRKSPLGIPKSSDVLDPALYADLHDVPDIVHEALWNLDFFRRLQSADGSVRGGIESASHPLLGVPSYLEQYTVFAYAPDHISTYRYATAAAKLAGILDRLGKTQVANLYRTSALSAWRWAEQVYAAPEPTYAEARRIAEANGAVADARWGTLATQRQTAASEHRMAAAGSLFRLTASEEYKEVFEAAWRSKTEFYHHTADGAWEYFKAAHATTDKGLQEQIGAKFVAEARATSKAQDAVAYPAMKHPFAPMGWGQGLAPDYNQLQMFIRAHQISGDAALLRTMEVASAHILGANQAGLSFTTGLGHRNIEHPLHEDHRAMGVKAPQGITIFGWAPQSATNHDWIFGPYWSPLPVDGTKEHAKSRSIAPNRFSMPVYEYLIEHPMLVMQQEYTVHQTIGTTAGMWLYLHAAGGHPPSR